MRISQLSRYRLGLCATAILAGCWAGSGTPLSSSPAGVTIARTQARPAYSVLYSFKGGSGDGASPYAADLFDDNGTLYGTTLSGGVSCKARGGCGTVFAITTSGTETVLHSFTGKHLDGAQPWAGLVNVNGTLYGTTSRGGVGYYGTVFSITTSGAETVLHDFSGSGDGMYPYASLLNVKGTLYGTTYEGGTNGYGTVFKITTSGNEKVIYSFGAGSADGENPAARLINVNGTLYGTTANGGVNGYGTVFKIMPSGKETVLHSFAYGSGDGLFPNASLFNVNGTLYGTTESGGANLDGTVFKITTSGTESILHSFGGSGDGNDPYAGLISVKGTLYGTTASGGANGDGTVFKITTSGDENVLYSFKGGSEDGENPVAGLINVKGTLYGTTASGGANGDGTVFSLSP